tara:strand:+ start:1018 stop:2217 length:1200 start_codon:yes stop_codon:yes gene_type:complete
MEENKKEAAEQAVEQPIVDNEVGKQKVKRRRKVAKKNDPITKVDLSKPKEDEVKKDNPVDEGVVTELKDADTTEKQEEVQPEAETQEEQPVLEEVIEEEVKEQTEELTEEVQEAIEQAEQTGKAIPENLQKVMDFMEETGGNLEDYVRLNQDYSSMDNLTALKEYYKQTKPHLTADEIDFMMEDQFSYNEEEDEEKDIKRKKLALKEQVASAKAHLDGQKSRYYEEIKAGSKLTTEQQKAINFFNRYNKESEANQKIAKEQKDVFLNKTNNVFNENFKGFDFNVGEKKYRFNVKNVNEVKETQSDINNFVKKFLNKNDQMSDAAGYHKSLFTAMNPDAIARHFYEQGKADAIKDRVARDKNINVNPRGSHDQAQVGGLKFKVLGNDANDFKVKIRKNKL